MEDSPLDKGIARIVFLLSFDVHNELYRLSRSGSIGDKSYIKGGHTLGQGLVFHIVTDDFLWRIRQVWIHWDSADLWRTFDVLVGNILYGQSLNSLTQCFNIQARNILWARNLLATAS